MEKQTSLKVFLNFSNCKLRKLAFFFLFFYYNYYYYYFSFLNLHTTNEVYYMHTHTKKTRLFSSSPGIANKQIKPWKRTYDKFHFRCSSCAVEKNYSNYIFLKMPSLNSKQNNLKKLDLQIASSLSDYSLLNVLKWYTSKLESTKILVY